MNETMVVRTHTGVVHIQTSNLDTTAWRAPRHWHCNAWGKVKPCTAKAKIAGHPIHPMLIPFPIALYTITVVALIAFTQTWDGFWFRAAIYANFAGVITAALAAIPGAIDAFLGIPARARARSTALLHGALNATTLVLFVISLSQLWAHRLDRVPDVTLSLVLGVVAIVLMLVAGALGWKLVQTHHVGVGPRAAEERDDVATTTGPTRNAPIPRNAP